MKLTSVTFAALAIAGLAILTPSAKAATVNVAQGDLLIGVYVTSGQGLGTTYVADLGSFTNFSTTATIDLSSKVSFTDLNTIFGANLANASFDLVATTGTNNTTAFGSAPGGNVYAHSIIASFTSAPNGLGQGAGFGYSYNTLNGATSSIGGLYTFFNGQTSTANSNFAISSDLTFTNAKGGSEWGLPVGLNTETSFGSTANLYLLDTAGNSGGQTIAKGSSTALGTLQFVGGTTLTFNGVAAAPEPSTNALLALSGLLAFAWILKRRQASSLL